MLTNNNLMAVTSGFVLTSGQVRRIEADDNRHIGLAYNDRPSCLLCHDQGVLVAAADVVGRHAVMAEPCPRCG